MRKLSVTLMVLLFVGLLALPAMAEPQLDCTPPWEDSIEWDNGVPYLCVCTTVWWWEVCNWVELSWYFKTPYTPPQPPSPWYMF